MTLPVGATRSASRRVISPAPAPTPRHRHPGSTPMASSWRIVDRAVVLVEQREPLTLLLIAPVGENVLAHRREASRDRCRLP
jgi:hypothetical protein